MACHYAENVYTTVFTPREYQVELLDTSKEDNTIVCLGNNNAKVFVSIKLLQELASEVRRWNGRRSVFLLDAQNVNIMSAHIRNLTDLTVAQYSSLDDVRNFSDEDWKKEIAANQVLVMTSDICLICMKCGHLNLKQINLLVIDDCRLTLKRNSLREILNNYSLLPVKNRPRILGLTTTVLSKNFDPARLEAEFEYMEKLLHCTVDTSSDIVTVLRYCSKPNEKVIICANAISCTLTEKLEMYIENAKKFLSDHRYDPFEIYEEEFHEELQDVPDPKLEPMSIFEEFLDVLRTLGPWCADRAAFALLIKIENLKVKTPYERHYLLLCMVSTVMVNIRALCDLEFDQFSNDGECIYAFSSPRILRLLQVLRTFKPDTPKKAIEAGTDAATTSLQPTTKIEEIANNVTTTPEQAVEKSAETAAMPTAAESVSEIPTDAVAEIATTIEVTTDIPAAVTATAEVTVAVEATDATVETSAAESVSEILTNAESSTEIPVAMEAKAEIPATTDAAVISVATEAAAETSAEATVETSAAIDATAKTPAEAKSEIPPVADAAATTTAEVTTETSIAIETAAKTSAESSAEILEYIAEIITTVVAVSTSADATDDSVEISAITDAASLEAAAEISESTAEIITIVPTSTNTTVDISAKDTSEIQAAVVVPAKTSAEIAAEISASTAEIIIAVPTSVDATDDTSAEATVVLSAETDVAARTSTEAAAEISESTPEIITALIAVPLPSSADSTVEISAATDATVVTSVAESVSEIPTDVAILATTMKTTADIPAAVESSTEIPAAMEAIAETPAATDAVAEISVTTDAAAETSAEARAETSAAIDVAVKTPAEATAEIPKVVDDTATTSAEAAAKTSAESSAEILEYIAEIITTVVAVSTSAGATDDTVEISAITDAASPEAAAEISESTAEIITIVPTSTNTTVDISAKDTSEIQAAVVVPAKTSAEIAAEISASTAEIIIAVPTSVDATDDTSAEATVVLSAATDVAARTSTEAAAEISESTPEIITALIAVPLPSSADSTVEISAATDATVVTSVAESVSEILTDVAILATTMKTTADIPAAVESSTEIPAAMEAIAETPAATDAVAEISVTTDAAAETSAEARAETSAAIDVAVKTPAEATAEIPKVVDDTATTSAEAAAKTSAESSAEILEYIAEIITTVVAVSTSADATDDTVEISAITDAASLEAAAEISKSTAEIITTVVAVATSTNATVDTSAKATAEIQAAIAITAKTAEAEAEIPESTTEIITTVVAEPSSANATADTSVEATTEIPVATDAAVKTSAEAAAEISVSTTEIITTVVAVPTSTNVTVDTSAKATAEIQAAIVAPAKTAEAAAEIPASTAEIITTVVALPSSADVTAEIPVATDAAAITSAEATAQTKVAIDAAAKTSAETTAEIPVATDTAAKTSAEATTEISGATVVAVPAVTSDSKVPVATAATEDVIKVNVCDSSEIPSNNKVNGSQDPINSVVPVLPNSMRPWKSRVMRGHRKGPNARTRPIPDPDSLCAIVFVQKRFTAKILYYLINELCHSQEDFSFLSVQYTVEKIADPVIDSREAEIEHRKQEEVLKKFRMHECNLLIATSVLEEGIDVPKCNLVVRFDQPLTYNSYVQCKGRAKMPEAHYVLLTEEEKLQNFVRQLAQYSQIEKMLLKKCKNREPTDLEEHEADLYNCHIQPYSPENSPTNASVSVATSVALVNKYCAKLPSDTFTRLTPLWWMQSKEVDGTCMFSCSIRLPINSPLKQTITGLPMPNRVLARRVAALQACRLLHQMGELDDNLLPVGKESFKAFDDDWNNFPLEESDEMLTKNNLEPRPGTTKRRQYYYKRVADALTDCRPLASEPAFLYLITMTLTCPLPEEQNTRGRKIYPPEDSAQGFGILTLKQIPKICPFPIFTRSGEVRVGLELASSAIVMTQEQLDKIMEFLNYIFTNVLRLQKYLMLFDPNASENSYFIVPTITNESGITSVDWDFLNEIYENRNLIPRIIPQEDRKDFSFNPEMYQDAVVMPWYRNQDQPQYFYVAEICNHLNPKSSFPGTDYKTFEEYYFKKYDIQIQNLDQPLLDVDHTSARLNFLTPRYVNRKGVALPTSSEETKRAKRENLEQKQILVPELCTVHPFPASLWRKAVCLPCILYRINALLLADQIRKQVAEELALGQVFLPDDFEWSPLNFGWSLSDVLKKSKENRQEKPLEQPNKEESEPVPEEQIPEESVTGSPRTNENSENSDESVQESRDWMEIGTWSNEMAGKINSLDMAGLDGDLPDNVTMLYNPDGTWKEEQEVVRYGSPTSWMQTAYFDGYDSDDSCDSYSSEPESTDNSNKSGGLRIEFKGDNCAEAIENESGCENRALMYVDSDQSDTAECVDDEFETAVTVHSVRFQSSVEENETNILLSGIIIPPEKDFKIDKKTEKSTSTDEQYETLIKSSLKLPSVDINSTQLKPTETSSELSVVRVDLNQNNPDYEKIDFKFSFDYQPDLKNHPGPSPSVILQALTMSNANDGINLERLETIGDSFLKYAITNYLYSTYDNIHEGKLSHLRSKQVSNLNLYRLGRLKVLGESMIATKFDPHDNWLPPCYYVPKELEQALIDARVPASHWNRADMPTVKDMSKDEICQMVREKGELLGVFASKTENGCESELKTPEVFNLETLPCFIPYNLITQHSIPDKSVADCVEALIGAYLIECGPRGALLFMAWLGIRVLPKTEMLTDGNDRATGSLPAVQEKQIIYGELTCPRSPLLHHCANPESELDKLLDGYDEFERSIQYHFNDRSYLLQALTHASYSPNTVTDCYQRLEFLGDAVLDYLITRHLYEDPRLHSPGALTDLRSALVNNTIFASLAVRHGFHRYFRHLSPGLHDVVNRFVQIQEENGHSISEEYYLIAEDESEEIEDVEVPKALGDVFESVAGAIFLDSGMSLDAVWRVYYRMMRNEIEQFSTSVPKSPIRELLELEPETAKFGKPEKLADGRRVRVTVEVFGKGTFKGIGRNYRIAKCTAAKCALKQLKKRGLLVRKS